MRILSLRPAAHSGGGNFRTLANFDFELDEDVRLFNFRLVEAEGGRRLTYAPSAGGKRCATFAPALADAITRLVSETYDRESSHARNQS